MKFLHTLLLFLFLCSTPFVLPAVAQDSTSCLSQSMELYENANYSDAYKSFSSCIKDIDDTTSAAYHTCILYLGACALENIEYKKASVLLHSAESFFEPSSDNYTFCKQKLAALAKRQGKYTEAETILLNLLQIQNTPSYTNCASKGITLNDLGVIYKRLGQYDRSIHFFTTSLQLKRSCLNADDPSITISLNNLAGVYMKQKNFGKADSLYSESIKVKTKLLGPNHPSTLLAYNNLAELYRQQGNYTAALNILQDVKKRKAASIGKNSLSYATTLHTIANVYYSSGAYKKSLPYCRKSILIKEHAAGKTSATTLHSYILQAKIEHALHHNSKAQDIYDLILRTKKDETDAYFKYLGEEDKIQYVKANTTYWKDFTNFTFDIQADSTKKNTINKNILLNQWIENRWYVSEIILEETQRQHRLWENITDSTQLQQVAELKQLKDVISQSYLLKSKSTDELAVLIDRAALLEKNLTGNSDSYKREQHTVREICDALDSSECIVEIIKPQQALGKYLALVYMKGIDTPYKIWLHEAALLEGKGYSYYTNTIKFKLTDNTSYALYWKSIADFISTQTQINKIYLVRDGVYEYLNIYTLLSNTDKKNPSIIHLHKTENILTYKQHTSRIHINQSLFVYHPIYGSGLNDCSYSDLPGTKKEADTIHFLFRTKSLPVTRYGEETATEARIKNDTTSYSLIHIATHGYLELDPDADYIEAMIHSGLLLSGVCDAPELSIENRMEDGILTAYEIAQLNLHATDLVVLSACQSGIGAMDNQEGLLGLQRGLLVAGAKKVLVSLWKIDDATTTEWMYYFYSNLIETNSCDEAYMFAQQKIKELHPFPYYWGAFVLLEQ